MITPEKLPPGLLRDVVEGRHPTPPCARLLGWELLDADIEAGTIATRFNEAEAFYNPAGIVQGGFLAAMLDDTLGQALMATLEPGWFAPTIELKISYIRSARTAPIYGFGRVVHRGSTIAFLDGHLEGTDGKLIATATATAKLTRSATP
ncbi:MAG: PaaI family thioesterase [Gammaproteobacteria bacterium]|nr:PaaI family thioesterase [Gammaproteobacteria bacterium]